MVLLFLNFYSSNTTRQLIYRAKAASLQDKAQLISSSFSGVDSLSSENVSQIIAVLGELNVERVIVTDATCMALYDSQSLQPAVGKQVLFREIVLALEGKDVSYCHYADSTLISHGAMPIMQHGNIIGSVYIADEDPDQGSIIHALEINILKISFGVEAVLVLFSCLFAVTSSRRMRQILISMQKAREGEYSHKILMHGSDEFGLLAREFNRLTDRLQASEQAQRQFVSDASHELKTPLASIKLLSDSILQNEMDAETMREFVGDIGSEADRLTRLTQKLLAISRAESAEQEHEVVDLSETIRKVFKMLVTLADERKIRLTSTMDKNCTVLTIEDDMYQIMFNLVENAIKYNHYEGTVHVRMSRQEEEVIVSVEDTGIGIPKDSIPYIFERFYRVDKARSREAGGAGLGLSIVHELVSRNDGTISVSSRPEGGSCFRVRFPLFEVEDDE